MNPLLEPALERRGCGHHALEPPILGVGCWSFGGGEYWGPQTQKDVDEVVGSAIDQGCNFFDTAEAYNHGASEESLGRALSRVPRERFIVCTKVSPSNTEPEKLIEHCEASLRRLRVDSVDIYMVHWPISPVAIRHYDPNMTDVPSTAQAFETLGKLQAMGKIRHIGVSNFGRTRLTEALETGVKIALNEVPHSLLMRAVESDILPFCAERGVGVLTCMALMQGILGGKYRTLEEAPAAIRRTRHFDCRRSPAARHGLPGNENETKAALDEIKRLSDTCGMTMAETAIRWARTNPDVTSVLCGARNLRQLELNLQAARQPLEPEIFAALNAATEPLRKALGPSFDYYENAENDRTQ